MKFAVHMYGRDTLIVEEDTADMARANVRRRYPKAIITKVKAVRS